METTTLSSDDPHLGADSSPELSPAAVLLLGVPAISARDISAGMDAAVFAVKTLAEAHEVLDRHEISALCLGSEISGAEAQRALVDILAQHPQHRGCNIVLEAGPELELFQDLVSLDRLYYLTQKTPPAGDVVHILESGVEHYDARRRQAALPENDERAMAKHRVLRTTERLARQPTLDQAVFATVEAIEELTDAGRAAVLLYDPQTETLWYREPGGQKERRESAAAGLVSFAVRTKNPLRLDRVGSDPRYDPEADNDGGSPEERFLAVPVSDPAAGGRVWAVLVALRGPDLAPFSAEDQELLRLLAEQTAPVFGRFLLQTEIEEQTARAHGVEGSEAGQLFRQEALEHHLQGMQDRGRVLEIAPGWTAWAYRLLLLIFVAALVFSLIGHIHEYASGTAVVRAEGQTDITASLAGTVVAVEVEPGRRVEAGELLVRLYGAQEEAELDRAVREFEIGLANRLRDPSDFAAERTLVGLRAAKTLAEKRLEERSVRAPHAGEVGDVRVLPGQHLTPGQPIVSLKGGEESLSILALLPGSYLPLLRPGMKLRFELEGYSYAYQHLVVDSVGEDAVGPAEARRLLGTAIADAVVVNGPVVPVTARLPSATFEAEGRTYEYHDGILGTAEVRVRSERILLALIPGLKALGSSSDG